MPITTLKIFYPPQSPRKMQ